jgi:hypothetical protein
MKSQWTKQEHTRVQRWHPNRAAETLLFGAMVAPLGKEENWKSTSRLAFFACGEEIDMGMMIFPIVASDVLRAMYVLIDTADNMKFIFGYLHKTKKINSELRITPKKKSHTRLFCR